MSSQGDFHHGDTNESLDDGERMKENVDNNENTPPGENSPNLSEDTIIFASEKCGSNFPDFQALNVRTEEFGMTAEHIIKQVESYITEYVNLDESDEDELPPEPTTVLPLDNVLFYDPPDRGDSEAGKDSEEQEDSGESDTNSENEYEESDIDNQLTDLEIKPRIASRSDSGDSLLAVQGSDTSFFENYRLTRMEYYTLGGGWEDIKIGIVNDLSITQETSIETDFGEVLIPQMEIAKGRFGVSEEIKSSAHEVMERNFEDLLNVVECVSEECKSYLDTVEDFQDSGDNILEESKSPNWNFQEDIAKVVECGIDEGNFHGESDKVLFMQDVDIMKTIAITHETISPIETEMKEVIMPQIEIAKGAHCVSEDIQSSAHEEMERDIEDLENIVECVSETHLDTVADFQEDLKKVVDSANDEGNSHMNTEESLFVEEGDLQKMTAITQGPMPLIETDLKEILIVESKRRRCQTLPEGTIMSSSKCSTLCPGFINKDHMGHCSFSLNGYLLVFEDHVRKFLDQIYSELSCEAHALFNQCLEFQLGKNTWKLRFCNIMNIMGFECHQPVGLSERECYDAFGQNFNYLGYDLSIEFSFVCPKCKHENSESHYAYKVSGNTVMDLLNNFGIKGPALACEKCNNNLSRVNVLIQKVPDVVYLGTSSSSKNQQFPLKTIINGTNFVAFAFATGHNATKDTDGHSILHLINGRDVHSISDGTTSCMTLLEDTDTVEIAFLTCVCYVKII